MLFRGGNLSVRFGITSVEIPCRKSCLEKVSVLSLRATELALDYCYSGCGIRGLIRSALVIPCTKVDSNASGSSLWASRRVGSAEVPLDMRMESIYLLGKARGRRATMRHIADGAMKFLD